MKLPLIFLEHNNYNSFFSKHLLRSYIPDITVQNMLIYIQNFNFSQYANKMS